ncbi:E3 ubiquitin-protein ligase Topors-like [Rhineura floridana]|uniref:E3 ubiquitin-protein ligase Topors-like n=1 Tax=Rhineura floridana TaxID=261503 RepID=UPI002AC7EDC0|nr:E3 ubiquitin-protein ligase Topors-like [Rhineura floridana]XP_061474671.1 E3 ubiquitin-protein ligase Topors-like [Rhineura floridana]
MRPRHKEFKPRTGLRSSSRGSLVKTMPTDTANNSKCAICLERIQDTTYLNPCNHRFCFDCIQKWSRKKVICPLCKQHFHSFFHTVSTKGTFCEYVLPSNGDCFSHYGSRDGHTTVSTERLASPPDNGILFDEIKGTLSQREKDVYQLMRQFAVTKSPANVEVISLGKFKAQAVIQFRRGLYHAGIHVQNAQNPDFNQIASAEFFSRNPTCFDRLIPWLKRELKVLCGNQRPLIHTLQNFILNNMTQHDLQSKEFEVLLWPHLRHFSAHFLHEFISFVQSPFNLKKYDWNASYVCPALMRQDSNSSAFPASSGDEPSQLPDNDQTSQADRNLDTGNMGCLHSTSQKDPTDVFTAADSTGNTKNEGHNLEDLSNSDTEKGRHTPDNFMKNKLDMVQLDKKTQPVGSLSHPRLLRCKKENDGKRELHPVQTRNSNSVRNSPSVLGSGDYSAFRFNHSEVADMATMHNSTKEETTKWQEPDFPTSHRRSSSSERHTTLSPGRKGVFKKSMSRGIEYSFEEGYSSCKGRHGGRGQARHQHEGRHHANYSRDRRLKKEQRKPKSRHVSLLRKNTLPFRNENLVAREMNKPKSQNANHFRKLRSKDYDYLRNRVSSEPGWRYLYYRQDCERYRYEDPLCGKGEPTRVYSPTFLASSRERSYFPPEHKISINQESLTKGWYHCSERCKSTGRPRGRFAVVGQERGTYDKLGGKRRHKLHHIESAHSRGGPRYLQNYINR